MNTSYNNTNKRPIPELLLAVHGGRENEVRSLLTQGADVNLADQEGITPLMAAAMEGHLEIAKILLEAGASFDKVNKWGLTAYDIALWHNFRRMAIFLKKVEQSYERET